METRRTGTLKRRVYRHLLHLKWCETGLCPCPAAVQSVFYTCRQNLDLGIYIKNRTEGSVFDLRRLNARTMTSKKFVIVIDALFAYDCALMAHQEEHLQTNLNSFSAAYMLCGLTLSLERTEMLVQAAPTLINQSQSSQ